MMEKKMETTMVYWGYIEVITEIMTIICQHTHRKERNLIDISGIRAGYKLRPSLTMICEVRPCTLVP